jgi:thiamine biosynthesis lipoprotein
LIARRWIITAGFAAAATLAIVLCAVQLPADAKAARRQSDFLIMNTEARVVIYADTADHASAAVTVAQEELRAIESRLNRYDPASEISALRAAAGHEAVAVSESTARAIEAGRLWWRESRGTFNPLVGSLVSAWKQAEKDQRLPTDEKLRRAMTLLDMDEIELTGSGDAWRCRLPHEGMQLDLGGLAKGWAADEALGAVRRCPGVRAALVVIGGDGACWSDDDWSRPWRFAVQDPLRGEQVGAQYAELALTNEAVVTSGDYYRAYAIGGRRYSHILDPRTGRPVDNRIASVTVIHRDGAAADSLATACVVLGVEEGLALLERLPDTEGLILEHADGGLAEHRTSGFSRYVVSGEAE